MLLGIYGVEPDRDHLLWRPNRESSQSNDVINQSRGTHGVLHVHKGKPTVLSSFAGTDQFYQLGCDLVQGQDKINIACFDGRLRHAEILRTGPVLCNHVAALLLDDLNPEGTITVTAREDNSNSVPFVNFRHRSKQRLGGWTGIMDFFRRGR